MSALLKSQQFNLFDAKTEAELYHSTERPGFFSILQSKDRKRQRSYKLAEMPRVIQLLDKNVDTWISQAEFTRPNRRVVNLWRIGMLFVDIDTYNIESLHNKNVDERVRVLLDFCDINYIPRPSLINFSGQGLQAKWFLDQPLPRAALPRWNRAQFELVNKLTELGADPKAKDASRVLRLVETVNTKSNEKCAVVYVTEKNGLPIEYDFDYLCDFLLPFSREQLAQMKSERHEEYLKRKSEREKFKIIKGGAKRGHLKGFSGRTLAWHRLEDLRTLAQLRGGVAQGSRMLHLFWQFNFLLLSGATNSNQMYYEAAALAHNFDPTWKYDKGTLSSLYERAVRFERGEKTEFDGKQYPALYTPKNDTLINQFEITEVEQRQLRTIITPALARERDADRDRARRRAAGAMERELYESNSLSRLKPWEQEGISRATWYRKQQKTQELEKHKKTLKTA